MNLNRDLTIYADPATCERLDTANGRPNHSGDRRKPRVLPCFHGRFS